MYGTNRQHGITFISTLVLLIIAGFFVLLLMRLGPIYLENYTVKSILSGLEEENARKSIPHTQIKKQVMNRLYINEVRRVSAKEVSVRKIGGGYKVEVKYEVRQHIMGNVDALMSFDDSVELLTR